MQEFTCVITILFLKTFCDESNNYHHIINVMLYLHFNVLQFLIDNLPHKYFNNQIKFVC